MAAASPKVRDAFVGDLQSAVLLSITANTTKTTKEREQIFKLWQSYCKELNVDESLGDMEHDPELRLIYVLVFAVRFRKTRRSGKPVQAGSRPS